MNSKFSPLYCKITRNKVFRRMSAESRLLFIYLLADENINLTGIFEIDPDTLMIKLRVNKHFDEMIKELKDNEFVDYDASKYTIWLINRFKLLPTKSPKVVAGTVEELKGIQHVFKDRFIEYYEEEMLPWLKLLTPNPKHPEQILQEDNLKGLAKIYSSKKALSNYLVNNRGFNTEKINSILERIFKKD